MKTYDTNDLNITTSLTVAGFELQEVIMDDMGRVLFKFNDTKELKKAVNDFRIDRLQLPAQGLLIKYRQLKAIVKEVLKENK